MSNGGEITPRAPLVALGDALWFRWTARLKRGRMSTGERMAGAADVVARAHARLLADHGIQFQFKTLEFPKPPAWLESLAKFLQGVGKFAQAVGPVFKIVLWGALALAVLWLLVMTGRLALRLWMQRTARQRIGAPAPIQPLSLQPTAQRAVALLEEADRLATQQRYEEAAHVLLFRTIADIDTRRPRAVRPALTSRDIAVLAEIPGAARAAFATLVERVEHSFFGGRSLGAADFDACRAAYMTFASPQSWTQGALS
jgi:hypothetical protein